MTKYIAVIPAKRRSRRTPNKNWRTFKHGESLAEKKFLFAIGGGWFDVTVVSVDFSSRIPWLDEKGKNKYALKVARPYTVRRRPFLMKDSSVAVMMDALDWVDAQDDDIYCLLQPTSPVMLPENIKKALTLVKEKNAKVVSVSPAYKPNGAIYAGYVRDFREYEDFYRPCVVPMVLDWLQSIDVDEESDFSIAQGVLE